MLEFVSYEKVWKYVNTCSFVVSVFVSGFIQMRFGDFIFFVFVSEVRNIMHQN